MGVPFRNVTVNAGVRDWCSWVISASLSQESVAVFLLLSFASLYLKRQEAGGGGEGMGDYDFDSWATLM